MAKSQAAYINYVAYSKQALSEIQKFKDLPKDKKNGSYWDDITNVGLSRVKYEIKQHYLIEQNYSCAYCKQEIFVTHGGAWDTDHIISKDTHPHFMFEPQNLCLSCKDCNNIKRAKNVLVNPRRVTFPCKPADYVMYHPHFHEYGDHIRVIRIAGLYLPRTTEGIRTIEVCGLMRFVLNYANYEIPATEASLKIQELSNELVNAQTPTESLAILNMIQLLVSEGLQKAARAALLARC